MTRTGALLWKEWRDHRIALAVFAAIVPLVSWPVQRWVFKFQEPEWTWMWVVPLCAGLATAIVAADLFAMDLATGRMSALAALPVTLRRHFGARAVFLVAVAFAFAAWTVAMNAALVAFGGKPAAVEVLLGSFDPAVRGTVMCITLIAAVVLFSSLGVGGFRAVIGGLLLAGIGYAAAMFAAELALRRPLFPHDQPWRDPLTWLSAAAVLGVAAYAGFVGGRAHATGRKRGTLFAAAILVAAFGAPAGAVAWKSYRAWSIVPTDPELLLQQTCPVSPDGRYVAVWGQKPQGGARAWIVRVEDGAIFDWPRRNEGVGGWTTDGLAWVGRTQGDDLGRFARAETGETVERAGTNSQALGRRLATGWIMGPRWAQWLRFSHETARPASKGVAQTYKYRLWVTDGVEERTVESRLGVCALPTVGEVLIVTPDAKLARVRLAGGEPEIVADDALALGYWTSGSPDGRYFIVQTTKGHVVLDSTDWRRVAGPWTDALVSWCPGEAAPAILAVAEKRAATLTRLVDVATGREIVPDASLDVLGGYTSVQTLPDGGFVARAGERRLLHLDADGKFIRRLFPPEE